MNGSIKIINNRPDKIKICQVGEKLKNKYYKINKKCKLKFQIYNYGTLK